jgi:hypothetical protein
LNRDNLDAVEPGDEIAVTFRLSAVGRSFKGLHIDVAVHNDHGVEVIHARSPFVTPRGADVRSGSDLDVTYRFKPTFLSPGRYFLTVYAYCGEQVLLWADSIDAWYVTPHSHEIDAVHLTSLRGAVTPPYAVSFAS